MSGWLNAYDFASLLNPYLLMRSAADVTDEATLAVDFSDVSVSAAPIGVSKSLGLFSWGLKMFIGQCLIGFEKLRDN